MAGRRDDDTEKTHDQLLDSLQQEPLSEEDADQLREEGRGFEREKRQGRDTGDEVERLASGQTPSTDARSHRAPREKPRTGEEPEKK